MLLMSLLVLTSSACSDPLALIDSRPEGAMLVWHNWPQPESDTLDDLLDRFRSVHPNMFLMTNLSPASYASLHRAWGRM